MSLLQDYKTGSHLTNCRLDSGSDGESLPGVAGAGQSNLSTGVAALIQVTIGVKNVSDMMYF